MLTQATAKEGRPCYERVIKLPVLLDDGNGQDGILTLVKDFRDHWAANRRGRSPAVARGEKLNYNP